MAALIRNKIKKIARRLKVDDLFRQGYVEANRLGERLYHSLTGAPDVSKAIILAGSGRSGTTWLSNIISTSSSLQPIFEPLFPVWNEPVRRLTGWDRSDPYFRQIYLQPDYDYPEWTSHLDDVLSGKFRNYWTDYDRTSYFPRRYLIKEIRMNMMLGYIYDRFKCNIVYLMRHPCAVVHSRLNLRSPWHANVKDILSQEELVDHYLQKWIGQIEAERDLLGAHAVWWAVENLVAQNELSSRPHIRVYYENTLLNPDSVAHAVLCWLELTYEKSKVRHTASLHRRNSRSRISRVSPEDFILEWQREMPVEDQNRILRWAHRLGVMDYSVETLPVEMKKNPKI